jgi:uridine kinase
MSEDRSSQKLTRSELLDYLAQTITRLHADEPTLVAIDGRSAAGKTTLADELAARVSEMGRPALRSSLDDFHPPGHKYRSSQRRYSLTTYYAEGYDYTAFRQFVLEPLRQGGSRRCRLAYWDSFNDLRFPETWIDVPSGAIVIVDGVFLLRSDLRHYWDYAIWVQIDWQTMLERAAKRDVAWVGDADVVVERYLTFWIPMHELYEADTNPTSLVNTIVDNQFPEAPDLLKAGAFESC